MLFDCLGATAIIKAFDSFLSIHSPFNAIDISAASIACNWLIRRSEWISQFVNLLLLKSLENAVALSVHTHVKHLPRQGVVVTYALLRARNVAVSDQVVVLWYLIVVLIVQGALFDI